MSFSPGTEQRPWGFFEVLSETPDHKIKRIVVFPGQRLSSQRHRFRSEHWFFLQGRAVVSRDGQEFELGPKEAIDLPAGCWHRLRNSGTEDLVLIEIQTGTYFGEDDIERAEDDYGRR